MSYLLHEVFTETVKNLPNNEAIVMENGNKITYFDLDKFSNKFANYFYRRKINRRENPYIGILSSVHIDSIAAVLGILKAGCAYVPLDEQSPIERLKYIINNTQMDTIVIDPNLYNKFSELCLNKSLKQTIILSDVEQKGLEMTINLNEIVQASDEPMPNLNQVSDDLAYVLHSSGSTGVPKGIMLTHRNARTFVDWMQEEFKLNPEDVVMSRAPFKFDLSVFDIFNTLKAGAKLVCYDWYCKRPENQKHSSYAELMAQQKATVLYTTPSTFISLMNKGNLDSYNLCLRQVMYAGEPFPVPQLRRLKSILPNTKVANIYGPTETNIITYYWVNSIADKDIAIPLGNEVRDTEILVVSEDGTRICNPGEIGELWCRGGTVTLGYLGLPELTEKNLVNSPFHPYPAKFWRTGDYGLRDEKGLLHYKGRKDHMVKVKGYRIEIGEIEAALSKCQALYEFAVVAIPDEKYGNRLYCFFSCLDRNSINEEDLRSFLMKYLPDYMIPFQFFKMENLPKTSSEKIDRIALSQSVNSKAA